jgi:subtilisin family serine protease
LKAGPLADHPVVLNMSFVGAADPIVEAAITYAINQGVIVVAAAGNDGAEGVDYPAAYPQVISVGAVGWDEQWTTSSWWSSLDVADLTDPGDFFIAPYSARELPGQDLDVVAPAAGVLGSYHVSLDHRGYRFIGGTSAASPHVTGTVALMAQKNPALSPAQAESILENTALPIAPGCRTVIPGFIPNPVTYCWGADATGHGLLQADRAVTATP